MSNETTKLLLETLHDEEQYAASVLRDTQEKKKQLLMEQKEEEEAALAAERQAYQLALKASPENLKVLGISLSKLGVMAANVSTLRVVRVHPDIERLLTAALVSRNEEHFLQLVSALAAMLVGSYANVKGTVHELEESSETAKYFRPSGDGVYIPISAKARVNSETLAALLSAWALEWGKATSYEEKE